MTQNPKLQNAAANARIKEMVRVYSLSATEMEKTLKAAALSEAASFRMEEHLGQVRTIISALDASAATNSGEIIEGYWGEGVNFASKALREQGIRPERDIGSGINLGAMQAITDQMAMDLLEANGTMETNARRILVKTQQSKTDERKINELLARGIVEGNTQNKTTGALTKVLLEDLESGARVKAGGRSFDPAYYAKMVAHTRYREAATEGMVQAALAVDVTLFQVSVHEGACEACQKYQGKVFSFGGADKRFPPLERRPPFHPNCEHVLLPFVEERYDEDELNLYAKMSNDDGYIASTSEWQMARKGAPLRKEPVDFHQKDAEMPAKKKPEPPARPRWERDRARTRENYKTEDREQSERLVSGLLKRDRDAYPTNRDGKPVFIHKHDGHPSPEGLLKDSHIWPKEISSETASQLCSALGELAEESKRLGIPGFRGLNFDIAAEKSIVNYGDGILGVNAKNIEDIKKQKTAPKKTTPKPFNAAYLLEPQDRVRACVYHEFAHHLHEQIDVETAADARIRPWEARIRAAWEKSKKGADSASAQASKDALEWFAENYLLSMAGLYYLVDPDKRLGVLLDLVIPR